jgi:hypothetical protein
MSVRGRKVEAPGAAEGMGAAAVERGFLLELNTKGMVGNACGPQVLLLFGGKDRQSLTGPGRQLGMKGNR